MNIDSLKEYIIPLVLLLLYFFVSSGNKGKKKPSPAPILVEEETRRPMERKKTPARRVEAPHESIRARSENKPVASTLAVRQFNAAVKADFSDHIVSQEMQRYSQDNLPVLSAPKRNPSRAGLLLRQQGSLRQAILLKEILARPPDGR